MKYTNNAQVSLSMAVWLAHDLYDHNPDPSTMSVTTLMKPLKQIILGSRVKPKDAVPDISNQIASRIGTALHTAVEVAWLDNYRQSMESLGYNKKLIDRVRINPTEEQLRDKVIPVYMEIRSSKKIGKITLTGKFDFIADGRIEDIKSTGTYTYTHQTKQEDYIKQLSIYKWLNQDKVTKDDGLIQFIFTDWKHHELLQNPKTYPASKLLTHRVPLMSMEATTKYVTNKVAQVIKLWKAPEKDLPFCTMKELWRDDTKYKYFSNPDNKKSTKNFDNLIDANNWCADKGKGKGIVKIVEGKVKACVFCDAKTICTQKDIYIKSGLLVLPS